MTKEQYEDFYKAAKWSISALRGRGIGEEVTKDGVRYVHVDGIPTTDDNRNLVPGPR